MTSEPSAGRGAVERSSRWERLALLVPGLAYVTAFMAVPTLLVLSYVFFQRGRFGGVVWEFTTDNFSRALSPTYRAVLVDSILIAGSATLLALLIGYPIAYAIAQLPARWGTIALVLVVIPFWTNFLVRTYAWIVLLSSEGLVNRGLERIGLVEDPLTLLYTRGAVVVGLVYAYLPLMILPLYASISKLDPQLREAATNLGASRWRVFRDITWPLTLPGAFTGCIFVLVPSLGNFVIPELLGGGKFVMVGNVVRDQFLKARDWPFGATLALVLVVVLALLFYAQSRVSRRLSDGGRS